MPTVQVRGPSPSQCQHPSFPGQRGVLGAFTGALSDAETATLPGLTACYGDAEVPSPSPLAPSLGFHEAFCKGATLSAGVPVQFYPGLHLHQHQVVLV